MDGKTKSAKLAEGRDVVGAGTGQSETEGL